MKAATSSPRGNLRLLIWLMPGSTTGRRRLFRVVRHGAAQGTQLARPFPQPPHGDPPQRLACHGAAHLRVAPLPLHELDRHLDDAQTGLEGAEGEVRLEDVAGRLDLVQPDPLERRTTEQAVAGRGVPYPDAEQVPGVEVAASREQLAAHGPVDDA